LASKRCWDPLSGQAATALCKANEWQCQVSNLKIKTKKDLVNTGMSCLLKGKAIRRVMSKFFKNRLNRIFVLAKYSLKPNIRANIRVKTFLLNLKKVIFISLF
jgi:hypothetical protein